MKCKSCNGEIDILQNSEIGPSIGPSTFNCEYCGVKVEVPNSWIWCTVTGIQIMIAGMIAEMIVFLNEKNVSNVDYTVGLTLVMSVIIIVIRIKIFQSKVKFGKLENDQP